MVFKLVQVSDMYYITKIPRAQGGRVIFLFAQLKDLFIQVNAIEALRATTNTCEWRVA